MHSTSKTSGERILDGVAARQFRLLCLPATWLVRHPFTCLSFHLKRAAVSCALLGLVLLPALRAQAPGTATIEGHVLHVGTGNYLNNAQVEVVGTGIRTFTNPYGEYRISNVPTGSVTLRVVYTGLPDQTQTLRS